MIAWLLACTSGPTSGGAIHLALGAQIDVNPNAVCSGVGCLKEMVEVRDVVAEDPSVVDAVEYDDELITLQGMGSGESLVTLVGLTDKREVLERHLDLSVAPIADWSTKLRCDEGSIESSVVTPGAELLWQSHKRDAAGEELLGEPQLDFGGIELSEENLDSAWLIAPPSAGAYRITSGLWEGIVDEIEVVDEEPDSLSLSGPSEEPLVESGFGFDSQITLGGEVPCVEELQRHATIESPEVCSFELLEELHELDFVGGGATVWTRDEGLCVIRVEVGELSETLEVEVVAG